MEKDITGIMVYYYEVCKRKLWYYYHNINMEQNNENVAIGKFIDENSYSRDEKHINIDNVINIDFIKEKGILHEVKKSKKIEEASILQVKYYLYYLSKRDVNVKAKIDYPLLKKNIILGAGADNFVLEFPQQDIKSKLEFLGDPYVIIDKPHNMFLQTGINDGCIALLVMIALFVLYVAQTIKRIFTDNNKYLQAVRYGLMAGCIAYMITGLTTDSVVSVAPVFWIMLGAGFGVNMIGIEKQEEKIK